jgi:hypothetical protein
MESKGGWPVLRVWNPKGREVATSRLPNVGGGIGSVERNDPLSTIPSYSQMSTAQNPKQPTFPQTPFQRFTEAVDGLMRVPHSEIKRALEQEKRANAGKLKRGPKPKNPSASVPSSHNEG